MPAIIPVIPFVLMLTVLPLPLVHKLARNSENHRLALVTTGLPTDPSNGPMYAELTDGTINNRVKVFFKDYTTTYYYRVETDTAYGTLSLTTDSDEATTFEMLPATDSGLTYKGQFYLGYETSSSNSSTVVVSIHSLNHMELMLDSATQDELYVSPIIGLISPYYHYYFE